MEWIKSNIEWIFSGIGVFLITLIISAFRKKNSLSKSQKQIQKSGNHSTNYQVGGNYNEQQNGSKRGR